MVNDQLKAMYVFPKQAFYVTTTWHCFHARFGRSFSTGRNIIKIAAIVDCGQTKHNIVY